MVRKDNDFCRTCQSFEPRDSTCRAKPPESVLIEKTTQETQDAWTDTGSMPQTNKSGGTIRGVHKFQVRARWPKIEHPDQDWCRMHFPRRTE